MTIDTLLSLYEESQTKVKQCQAEIKRYKSEVARLSKLETDLCHLKIENANLQSKVEDLEERNEYYKKRIKRTEINSMGLATMMYNPYTTDNSSAREPAKVNTEEHQSSGKSRHTSLCS